MYCPYVALLWNHNATAHRTHASEKIQTLREKMTSLTCLSIGAGAAIFDGPSPHHLGLRYVLADGHGVIYGRLFSRNGNHPLSADDVSDDHAFARSCVDTRGANLVKDYWGSYVAIIVDQRSMQHTVIRDCSGQVPCYYTTIGQITAVFSDIRHIEPLLQSPAINWQYLAAFLSSPHLEIRDTGLLGISELLAGEGIYLSERQTTNRFAWNPVSVCMENPIIDSERACVSLREATQLCISAWVPIFREILHSLSGGFDSSLVLQLLARAVPKPDVTCVNWYSRGPQEDERTYARIAARHCETELLEVPMDIGAQKFDERCLEAPRTPKPSVLNLIEFADAPAWNELCSTRAPEAIWTGQGGDHIFMAATCILGISDCLRLFGFGRQTADALRNAVILTRRSFWHVIVREASLSLSARRFLDITTPTPEVTHLCTQAIPAGLRGYTLHPWYHSSSRLPPGKRYQLLILSDVINRHRPMPDVRTAEDFHPLLSQPIIETSLRIPLSLLLTDGKTRGLARKAFTAELPQKIACREQKGEAGSYILGLFRRSSQFIAELLLDGRLVRDGILSRNSLLKLLDADFAITADQFNPLFACMAAELWARTWTSR